MDIETLDKQIIILDSNFAVYNSTSNIYDYYIDIQTPIKDVMYIKLINTNVILNNSYITNDNTVNNDNIFVYMNNYNRILANTISITSNVSLHNYFDNVIINKSKYLQTQLMYNEWGANHVDLTPSNIDYMFNNKYDNDMSTSVYKLNPIEPNLRRFNIRICSSDGSVLDNTYISRVITKICVYYNNRKFTMR